MPFFKFNKSTKNKPPKKSSSMGSIYLDYSGGDQRDQPANTFPRQKQQESEAKRKKIIIRDITHIIVVNWRCIFSFYLPIFLSLFLSLSFSSYPSLFPSLFSFLHTFSPSFFVSLSSHLTHFLSLFLRQS